MADNLSAEQQKQIDALKQQWNTANASGDKAAMDKAHADAEAIRNQAGFSGGASGDQYIPMQGSQGSNPSGGMTANEMQQWVNEYDKANQGYSQNKGGYVYNNGYSAAMNNRSQANMIRQQMEANSKAWATADQATRDYLHQQNIELEKVLRQANGGAQSEFNPQTGRWETWNGNLGYGTDMNYAKDDVGFMKNFYGMTDDQLKQYANDTDRYHNFVDTNTVRNWIDESPGYTGRYSQFVNGPYASLMSGTDNAPYWSYMDVIGDGFGNSDYTPTYDANGNIVPQKPTLKNNQFMTDYTRDLAGYVQNGVIMPNMINKPAQGSQFYTRQPGNPQYDRSAESYAPDEIFMGSADGGSDPGGAFGQGSAPWRQNPVFPGGGGSFAFGGSSSGGGANDLSSYINNMYDENIKAQMAALESAHKQNLTDLQTAQDKANAAYSEQKRQAAGQSERDAAAFREVANAQGLNSGAFGQAALVQNNQLQSDLNTLGAAQAAKNAEIEQRRALLGQQYQLAITQAHAENDMRRAEQLYQEAVRMDEALRQEQQFYASMAQDRMNKILSMASSGISVGGGGGGRSSGGRGYSSGSPVDDILGSSPNNDDEQSASNVNDEDAPGRSYFGYGLSGEGWTLFKDMRPNADGNEKAKYLNRISSALSSGYITQRDATTMVSLLKLNRMER